ncbi:MAG: ABC-F family ATP-binding cassette domain-containing protein [Capsulimonadales bacterium]|nr:ABC-F family ATP-binding cassette domain-containing protein [Capsulimonadales bacterium]
MSLLTVVNVAKSFGAELLFTDIQFSLAAGQKMGLIGRNGGGKTTLIRILLGQETPDASVGPKNELLHPRIAMASGRRMGYLRQEAPVHPEHTIEQEIDEALAPLRAIERRLQDAEHAMSTATDDAALEKAMADYTAAQDDFEAHGGYAIEEERDSVLEKLGFGPEARRKRVGDCSGGEQTRLALAKLVLTRPDLLVLDEPTNHLDIDATEWLEGFLKSYPGAVLLISHDRYFLDAVTDTIAELENKRLTVYKGNYSHFRQQKEERMQRQQELYDIQQAEISRLQDLIKRNMGADANASNIRHKTQGRIDRMEKIDPPGTDIRTVKARFETAGAGRIGREVMRLTDLSKRYGERTLFSDLHAVVERNDRVGVVGPNGAGKTTLVRMILGEEPPTGGEITFGHNVRPAYFSQHATDRLEVDRTVVETLTDAAPTFTETEARNYLGRFLFSRDDVHKTVGMLSGGEKNKLALALMLLRPCNLLILDEPTNHLDMPSVETLTEMLSRYDGTLLIVSHDRYLLNAVTTKTLGLTGDGGAAFVEGNYAVWRDTIRSKPVRPASAPVRPASASPPPAPVPAKNAAPPPVAPNPALAGMSAHERSKARTKAKEATDRAERAVHEAEKRLADVEAALASGGKGTDLVALAAEHTRLRNELQASLTAWENAAAEAELLA